MPLTVVLDEAGTLLYDADCGFCTRSAVWLSERGRAFSITPWQSVPDLSTLGLTEADLTTAAYWRTPDGRTWRGADAIGKALQVRRGPWSLVGRLILSAPVRPLAGIVYARVASNRYRMPGGTGACRITDGGPRS